VEEIVREEMNRAGAVEILMPAVQPAELWQESGRWDYYGRELLRFRDRHDREACIGPTHEEVITDLVRNEIHSYKQMPINFYQIQTKFRDEIRPRFGVMRAREFIMKDAYSFDTDEAGVNESYQAMHEAYTRIFERCGLKFRAVEADTGAIGGSFSHEFMVLADTGEDQIVNCTQCGYAANLERAEVVACEPVIQSGDDLKPLQEVETPDVRTIEEVTSFLSVPPDRLIKTLIFLADDEAVAVLVRGDHDLNEVKLKNFLEAQTVELADARLIEETTGAPVGFAGPQGLHTIKIVADQAVSEMKNAVTGANKKDFHVKNVNLNRDFRVDAFGDLRVIAPGDACPRCAGPIHFGRGIEVGHIFKLGTKYSEALKAVFLDENGKEKPIVMGCYGIGIGRTVAAAIEQNHDEKGIIFPIPIAPFEVTLLPLQMHESAVTETAEWIYRQLLDHRVDALIDDRDERAGVKFNDADLMGIPIRVTVGSRGLKAGKLEVKIRDASEAVEVPVDEAPAHILKTVKDLYDSVK
jgi:prolyl-tRNA synthetase